MRWKQMAGMPEKKPKKDGWIVKPQYAGDILVLDLYTDREIREMLCRMAQEEYEKTHTREEWMAISRKNYL